MHTFAEIGNLGLELRRITKRIVIDVNSSIFSEHVSALIIQLMRTGNQLLFGCPMLGYHFGGVRACGGALLEPEGRNQKCRFSVALEEDQAQPLQRAAHAQVQPNHGAERQTLLPADFRAQAYGG